MDGESAQASNRHKLCRAALCVCVWCGVGAVRPALRCVIAALCKIRRLEQGTRFNHPCKLARTPRAPQFFQLRLVAPPVRPAALRMQPLAEPLLRDAAPEPPAGTARLLLTSHVLTKFGSKAWEVRVT